MDKKFRLTKVTKEWCGITLFQIEALVSFGNVTKGDKGGYVEKENNLDQSSNAWVYDNAQVYGDARVYGEAWVSGKLKLTLGYFFGLRYKKEEIKYVKLDDNYEIVCKGDIKIEEDTEPNLSAKKY